MARERDYKDEYNSYHKSAEQKKRRAQRNKARRKALREGRVRKGDNKEVGHIGQNRKGKLGSRTKVISRAANRRNQPKRDGSED